MRRSLVILLLLTVACGRTGDSTTPPETTTTEPTATTAEPTTSTTAAEETEAALTINIVNFAFQGHSQAAVGDTINVVNADNVTHTWTASDGSFHSGNLSPGDSFTFTFDQPGTFDYFCQIHPSMAGSITVDG
jgi:plastocyanin